MTNRKPVFIALAVALIAAGAFALTLGSGVTAPVSCAPIEIKIDNGNSVHGLKEGKLFGYIDLAESAPALACHTDAEIQGPLSDAVTQTVTQWWQEARLQKTNQAEIHIISILDKDEYARASFNSAMVHGKMEFNRAGDKIEALPTTLTFDNVRKKTR